ncbi:MAG: GGDEF domain-containing protein [Candidatus Omnitrophica bacterium]|nr:GGDEF domain-containing protein [Candidatus Omnitrophota bacterium]
MKTLRSLIFLAIILYIFALNIFFSINRVFSSVFYFVSLTVIVAVVIIMETIYSFAVFNHMHAARREKEKMQLALSDLQLESLLLKTLSDIIETFGEEISIEDVLEKIADSLKKIFRQETVALQLMGENFKKSVIGRPLDLPDSLLTSTALKPRPLLINNTKSFPQYAGLASQGITSFIISTFHHKRKITGIIGVFSFDNRSFTIRDLDLLRMVSAPTSLLVENTELFEKTKLLSITDALTHLYNRRHFEEVLEKTLAESAGKKTTFSVCMADIDYFKHYNDINGHPAGDAVLKKISGIIIRSVKGSDIVARYGGEEIIIVFPDTSKENAVKICETIRRRIRDFKFPNEESQPNGDLTCSFGVAAYPQDAQSSEEVVKKADFALYKAKEGGRNRIIAA